MPPPTVAKQQVSGHEPGFWAPAGPDEFLGGVTSADFGGQGDAVFVGVGEGRCQPTPGGLLLDESFLLDLTNGGWSVPDFVDTGLGCQVG
jgi:hypothetical protein